MPGLPNEHALAEGHPIDLGDAFDDRRDGVEDRGDLLTIARSAETQAETHMQNSVRTGWQRSYRAFRNEHFDGSKYRSKQYAGRSKLFRPKTRGAVRKAGATTAQALFSTQDAISIVAQNEADDQQRASAAIIKEVVSYRLDKTSGIAALPWFLTAMGAQQDAQITGLCGSKQYWQRETRKVSIGYEVFVDEETGEEVEEEAFEDEVLYDRPMVDLYPPENILMDPAADWRDPAQSSAYLILRTPMHATDIRAMIESGGEKGGGKWDEVSDGALRKSAVSYDAKGVRLAREGGNDRYDQQGGAISVGDYEVIWVHENFMRKDGQDWHFWSLGTDEYLTDPVPVKEAYPEQFGLRPVVIGLGALESHRIHPMSNVEMLQQLQQEANDVVNLRLDNVKMNMSPVAKVRRGRKVDLSKVATRAPGTTLLLQDLTDVEWDRPQDVTRSSYEEMNHLNADIDDLAGVFSGGSVQTNRSLNETVGGMGMLRASAGAVSEFDLKIWLETYIEPTLRQIVNLVQYYENDVTILALAAEKAQLFQKYGISEISDELLERELNISVNVTLGGSDPMVALQKFGAAAKIAMEIVGDDPRVRPKSDEIIDEVFGKAGIKGAAKRFFDFAEDEGAPGEGVDPMAMQQQAQMQQQQAQLSLQEKLALAKTNNDAKAESDKVKSKTAITVQMLRNKGATDRDSTKAFRDFRIQQQYGTLENAANAGKPAN